MDGEEVRHRRKGQVDRRAAAWAEATGLDVAAVGDLVPVVRLPGQLDRGPVRKGQVGAVPGAAGLLAIAALAMVHEKRLGGDFIADRAAGASPGKGVTHVSLSLWC